MDHVRENRSLLAAAERRLLVALARRTPTFINSDHLTALAFLSTLGAAAAFAFIPTINWAAPAYVALLFLNWIGDSLDGTLARVRNHQRPRYGYYVDHVIDVAGTAALVAGMAASGLMTPALAFALLAVYLMVASETFLAAHAEGIFRMSFAGFGPTELRIVLAIGAIKVAADPVVHLAGRSVLMLDVGGTVAIVGLLAAFFVAAIRNTISLYRAEPSPTKKNAPDCSRLEAVTLCPHS